jgi:hypothetical protein
MSKARAASPSAIDQNPIKAQHVHGQAAERGHDLHAVGLAVAVRVILELDVAGPMPGVLD